jgi:hypothetical protein
MRGVFLSKIRESILGCREVESPDVFVVVGGGILSPEIDCHRLDSSVLIVNKY